MIQPIILCGGSGTRLWPLSRKSIPKQFIPLIEGKSLLQSTFERVQNLANEKTVWTVANKDHRFLVRDAAEAANVPFKSILEPVSRNTAAAMAAAALNAEANEILLFLPADHHIADNELFIKTIHQGLASAKEGEFITFGIQPTSPNNGYGYIQINKSNQDVKPVKCFVEKPDKSTAQKYLESGDYFWNAGIFLVEASALIQMLKEFVPEILEAIKSAVDKQKIDSNFIHLDKEAFISCRSESIDYAVLEKNKNISMVVFPGTWSDVGSWNAVANLSQIDNQKNQISGKGKAFDSKSTFIYAPYRPVVALGTEELLIVDTIDAVLVLSKSHAEQVKDVVVDLQKNEIAQATEHRHVARPWGQYDCIDIGEGFLVKRITVNPGAALSLQMHHYRAEHWIVVKGSAKVTRGQDTFMLLESESTFIPVGTMHRLENPGTKPLEMIEVQTGSYLSEDDIERFDDQYGRKSF